MPDRTDLTLEIFLKTALNGRRSNKGRRFQIRSCKAGKTDLEIRAMADSIPLSAGGAKASVVT